MHNKKKHEKEERKQPPDHTSLLLDEIGFAQKNAWEKNHDEAKCGLAVISKKKSQILDTRTIFILKMFWKERETDSNDGVT